jgi:hypothetical protein
MNNMKRVEITGKRGRLERKGGKKDSARNKN